MNKNNYTNCEIHIIMRFIIFLFSAYVQKHADKNKWAPMDEQKIITSLSRQVVEKKSRTTITEVLKIKKEL